MLVHAEAGRVGELHRDASSGWPVVGRGADGAADSQHGTTHLGGGIPRSRRRDAARPLSQSDRAPAGTCVLATYSPAHAQAEV